ncbi:biotin carboxyl carrier protein of acetyl-CoA carboxylase AccB [Gottschalkia purinilytica]|uniref:Biotin carboxyl carrier protein of acetyl-CoA carboxylase n=1 Tax=Gottschalkia purinilytica TaxID=1503 RepID=A0A0L0W8L6_GOTPU|nr:acetyl-CoA carboxylase biotin carboxyl carrier protein [Gottschalkia purinilytica]KNF07792.1 biotin carboxyl carrier protein of acetyl-CoA carboxylase AccB [Gottschalkia purinilytica]
MVDIKDIKDLILTIDKTKIDKVDIENGNFKISISKNSEVSETKNTKVYSQSHVIKDEIQDIEDKDEVIEVKDLNVEDDERALSEDMYIIKSPIVGTFYGASSPDAEPFVKVGSKVNEGQTLCIIEAMKIMNEIESEVSGEIFEILVENEDIVEYDQPLMIIRR